MANKRRDVNSSPKRSEKEKMQGLYREIDAPMESARYNNVRDVEKMIAEYYLKAMKVARQVRGSSRYSLQIELEPKIAQRRKIALAEYIMGIQDEMLEKYPNLNVVESFVKMDAAPYGAYKTLEGLKGIILGAAIWIIDELERKHKLQEAGLCLSHDPDEYLEIDLPNMSVPGISDELLRSMMYAIFHRNDTAGYVEYIRPFDILTEEAAKRYESIEYTKPETSKNQKMEDMLPLYEDLNPRQKFDAIMAMISQTRIDRAVERYKKAMDDFIEFFFGCSESWFNKYRKKAEEIKKELHKFEKNREEQKFSAPSATPLILLRQSPVAAGDAIRGGFNPMANPLFSQMNWITNNMNQLTRLHAQWEDAIMNSAMVYTDDWIKPREELFGKEGVELADRMEIGNPYEICFAFLYLLDSGSDLAWIHGINYAVLTRAASMLPWGYMTRVYEDIWDDEEYADYSEEDESEPQEEYDYEEELLKYEYLLEHPKDLIQEEKEMYRPKYKRIDWEWRKEHRGTEPQNCNFPQYIYELEGVVIPRDARFAGYDTETFIEDGFTPEQAELMMHLGSLASVVSSRPYDWSDGLFVDLEDDPDGDTALVPADEEQPVDLMETLQKQNKALKVEMDRLRTHIHELQQGRKEMEKQAAQSREERELERQELIDLRELIFQLQHGEEESVEIPEDVAFPYNAAGKVVVFGGHDTWLKAIRPMLPNVRFIDRDMVPKASTIRHADVIWIQTNALSHSSYYNIMDVVRTHKKPVRYFTSASAEKCARLLAADDLHRQKS